MLTVKNKKGFDWVNIPLGDCLRGNALDTHYTAKVFTRLYQELENSGLVNLYQNLISPLQKIFTEIEFEGLLISEEKLAELKAQLESAIKKAELEMLKDFPGSNLGSARDLIKILFSMELKEVKNENGVEKVWSIMPDFGFGLYPAFMTEKDQPKTDEDSLKALRTMLEEESVKRGLHVKKN